MILDYLEQLQEDARGKHSPGAKNNKKTIWLIKKRFGQ